MPDVASRWSQVQVLCDDAIEVFVERCVTVEADGVCDAVLNPHERDVTGVESPTLPGTRCTALEGRARLCARR